MRSADGRIEVADALRGIAVVGIILFHAVESFNAFSPQARLTLPCDASVYRVVTILLSGKMYGIFALLFGLTFHIMLSRTMTRIRFAWRMLLLFFIGGVNIAIYDGDILTTYALCGLLLTACHRLSNRWLWVLTVVVLLQPFELWQLFSGWTMPSDWIWHDYALLSRHHQESGFCLNVMQNLRYAFPANLGYFALTGRLTQIFGLFVLGLLFGRYRLFLDDGCHLLVWKCILIVSLLLAVVGNCANLGILTHWLTPIVNLAVLLSETAAIVLLWYGSARVRQLLTAVCIFGRMSLTNYLLQSVLGCFLFYAWGLGLFSELGHTYALFAGVVMVMFQLFVTLLWARHHQRGPVESLWRAATYICHEK